MSGKFIIYSLSFLVACLTTESTAFAGGSSEGYSFGNQTSLHIQQTVPSFELSSFGISVNGETVLLKWATTNENGLNHFEIERSEDQHNVKVAGLVLDGISNSSTGKNYQFKEQLIKTGNKCFYRLKGIDKNGQISYSKWLMVKNEPVTRKRRRSWESDMCSAGSVQQQLRLSTHSTISIGCTDCTTAGFGKKLYAVEWTNLVRA